ncbi:MAG: hypothetical protein NTV06_09560, partial [candidate division Zixibacteria bacterium]|nr:hypothetical protein [candidate division Zixibacteria bacterium]
GMERLVNLFNTQFQENSFRDPREISELVISDIDRHAGMAVQNDDITFITISCTTSPNIAQNTNLEPANLS